jgi:hypothetical protein
VPAAVTSTQVQILTPEECFFFAWQVLLCRDSRVRRCQPMPLRGVPFKDRFYVSQQLNFAWAYIGLLLSLALALALSLSLSLTLSRPRSLTHSLSHTLSRSLSLKSFEGGSYVLRQQFCVGARIWVSTRADALTYANVADVC